MKAWIIWAVLSAFLGAAVVVISSLLLRSTPTAVVALFRGIGIVGVSAALLATAYGSKNALETIGTNIWSLLLLGLVSAGSILSFYAALKLAHKDASDEIVTAINYSSLVLIAALNIMLGRETFSLQTLLGITLVFVGLAVLSMR